MTLRQIGRSIFLAVALLVGVRGASGTTLLVNQINPYLGYGYGLFDWTGMTNALDTAFGAGNITVSNVPLDSLATLLTYDRLWITARQPGDPFSAAEQAALTSFIATGRRVALLGENSAWTTWNQGLLATVGGTYAGTETSNLLTPTLVHPITAGLSGLDTISDGVVATGGVSLFNENVATLWGASQSVFSLLSINVIDNSTGASANNSLFKANVANWLAGVPEPASAALGAFCVVALASIGRRRGR